VGAIKAIVASSAMLLMFGLAVNGVAGLASPSSAKSSTAMPMRHCAYFGKQELPVNVTDDGLKK